MLDTPDPFESLARIRGCEDTISRLLAFEEHLRDDDVTRGRLDTAAAYLDSVIARDLEIKYGEANS